jgi:hypothetical protein
MADYQEPYLTYRFTGINYDTPAYDLPLEVWSAGQNVRFSNGSTEKFLGHDQVFGTLGCDPNWFIPIAYGANYYWVYADTSAVFVTDMAAHFDITPVAGIHAAADIDTNWNGGRINNIVVMNNGKEVPIWWDGATSNPMTALTGFPANTTAEVIRVYKQFLVAMNVTESSVNYPDRVQWSDVAPTGSVPIDWDHTSTTNKAGRTDLADSPGAVIDGLPLGDAFILYKRKAIYLMQFVGGQFVHNFRKLHDEVGILAANCAAVVKGNLHLVLTSDDLVTHDGTTASPVSILDSRMRTWLFKALSTDYLHRSYIVSRHARREMWVCFPTGGSTFADTAIIWNYEDDTIGVRQVPLARHMAAGIVDPGEASNWDADSQVWDDDPTTWDEGTYSPTAFALLIGDQTNSKFFEADKTNTFDGVPFVSYVIRESMPLVDRHNFKLIKGLYPRMSATGNPTVKFRVGFQVHATDPINWKPEQDFVIGIDDKVDVLGKGRYISLQVKSSADVNWQLHSFDLEVEKAERY